ncbi:MAG: prepilin-type N-terminal cleavage/methylation domain-containing protein [bacterium]|nr:prepilin-type N-terminal cleavage/methylation domain-containing protein [bacterium]
MRKGFTLIELLIVIAIIGLLATLAIVSLTTAQQKARDTKRIADLKQLQNATELYFSEVTPGSYPAATTWAAYAADVADYISVMPIDPTNDTDFYYVYADNDTGDEYVLGATLENTTHSALNGDDDTNYTAAGAWLAITPISSSIATPATVNCSLAGAYCLSE